MCKQEREPGGVRIGFGSPWELALCLAVAGCGAPIDDPAADDTAEAETAEQAFHGHGSRVTLGATRRVSVSSSGAQGDFESTRPEVSGDGKVVGFVSLATNLVPGDTNNVLDIFVHNLRTQRTERVSVSSEGVEGNQFSDRSPPALDHYGRLVAFESAASNLVPGDTNDTADVFLHDRIRRTTFRTSVATDGSEANDGSAQPGISANGRFVAFISLATNLVPNDTNGVRDVFVRDLWRGTTERVSVASDGTQGNAPADTSAPPRLSADGRLVLFGSLATNLVPGATTRGVYVHDRRTLATIRVDISSSGEQPNMASTGGRVDITADGRFVGFSSSATNLVPGDTNGQIDVFIRDLHRRTTERVSVSSSGAEGNDQSGDASISDDGRFVVFLSAATNFTGLAVPQTHVYIRDRGARTTRIVSTAADGSPADAGSPEAAVSGNGKTIAIWSQATNLVLGDTNGASDIFVRDLMLSRRWHR